MKALDFPFFFSCDGMGCPSVGLSAGFPETNEMSFGGSKSVDPPKEDRGRKDRGTASPLSFREAVKGEAERLYFDAFAEADKPLAYELCAILAEVKLMRPSFSVRIGGEVLEASLVSEVFSCLTHEHLCRVIEAFDRCQNEIRNKKAYLRTSLYNAVFELEAGERNLYHCLEG